MLNVVRSSVAAIALAGVGLMTPAMAQDASEMAVRMQMLEEQVRTLSGQVEQLSYEVQQLKGGAVQKSGALQQAPAVQPARPVQQVAQDSQQTQQQRLAAASADAMPAVDGGVETIEQQPLSGLSADAGSDSGAAIDTGDLPGADKAPGPQVLGALGTGSAKAGDGGFQGKVLVPPSQQEPGDDVYVDQNAAPQGGSGDSIETVSLAPEAPEALYERSNESLLRRQFADAEAGFSTFLTKYPDHGLAGSAQYWLGETYYAQRDYKRAAQTFLQGYKKYPNSRRAADSLLKLGISLDRLGQSQQACAAYAAVSSEYPKAVEARKRAQAEARRAGCAS